MARLRSTRKPHAASRPQSGRDTGGKKAVESGASSTKGSGHAFTDEDGALQSGPHVESNQMTPGEEEKRRSRCRGQRSNNHSDQPSGLSITEGEEEQLSQILFDPGRCGGEKHSQLKSTGEPRCQIDCSEDDSSDTGTLIEVALQSQRRSHPIHGEGDDTPEPSSSSTSVENSESLMDDAWKLMRALFCESASATGAQEETTVPPKLEVALNLTQERQESGGITRSTQKRAVKRSRKRKHSTTSSTSESPYQLLCDQLMFFSDNGYTSLPPAWPESCRRRRPSGRQDNTTAKEEDPPQWLYNLLLGGVCCHASNFRFTSLKTPSLKSVHVSSTAYIENGNDTHPGTKARQHDCTATIGNPTLRKFYEGEWSLESVASGVWPDIRSLHTVCRVCSEWCDGRGSRFGKVQSIEASDLASGLAISVDSSQPTSPERQSANSDISPAGLERKLVVECGERVQDESMRTTSSAPASTSSNHLQYNRSNSIDETNYKHGSEAYLEVAGEIDEAKLDEDSAEKYDERVHLATEGACRFTTSTRRLMAWELERFSDKVLNVVLLGYLYDQSDKPREAKTKRAKRRSLRAAKWEYANGVLSDFVTNSEISVQGLDKSVIERAERRMRKLAVALASTSSEIQRLP